MCAADGSCACPTGQTLCNNQCVTNCRNGYQLNQSTCVCECPTGKKVCPGFPSFCVLADRCCNDGDCVQGCTSGTCCTPADASFGVCKGSGVCRDFFQTCFAANPCETATCTGDQCVKTPKTCSGCFACNSNPGSPTAGMCTFDNCSFANPCTYCDGTTCRANRALDYQSWPCNFHGGGFCYDGQCVTCLPAGDACTADSQCCTDACQPNPNGQIGSRICTCVPAGAPGCVTNVDCCNNCCASGGFCAFFSEDLNNCGACGVQVPAGGICDNGTPTCTLGFHNDNGRCCPVGAGNCGSYCANTSTDPLNCGNCGFHCDIGHPVCASGRCCTIVGTDCY